VEELAQAIADENLARLTSIPGIGRKTAERLILELKNQIAPFLVSEQVESPRDAALSSLEEDVLSALVNLGYPKTSAEKALASALRSPDCERTFEDALRNTLRRLAG
jgi:Holliday junction DNA helicase RuvA